MADVFTIIGTNWSQIFIEDDEVQASNGKSTLPVMKRKEIEREFPGGTCAYPSKRFERFDGVFTISNPTDQIYKKVMNGNKIFNISINASFDAENNITGDIAEQSLEFEMAVTFFGVESTDIEPSNITELEIPYEAKAVRIVYNGTTIADIDKRIGKFILDGSDLNKAFRLAYGAL